MGAQQAEALQTVLGNPEVDPWAGTPRFGDQHSRLTWALDLLNASLWELSGSGIGVSQHSECTVVILQGRNAFGPFF